MKRIFFLLFSIFCIVSSQVNNPSNCGVGLDWDFPNDLAGDDTDNDPILNEYKYMDTSNGKPVESFECTSLSDYFDFLLITGETDKETKNFRILKNQFSKLDELINADNPDVTGSQFQIVYNCEITCDKSTSEKSKATIRVTITDKDQHPPEFSAPEYDIKVPMPLPIGTDLTAFIKHNPIYTMDKDFSNKKVTYILNNGHFLINSNKDGKKYTLEMEVASKLNLIEDTPYVITATDDGGKTSTATLNIIVDKENSISDQPSFLESSYEFLYDVSSPTAPTISTDATIKIKTDNKDFLEVGVEDDFKANIQCNQTGTDSDGYVTVECTCLKAFTDSNVYYFVKVNAKTDESTSTTLVIKNKNLIGPQFEQGYYEAKYNQESETVTLTTPIKTLQLAKSVEIQGGSDYFKTTPLGDHWIIERTDTKLDDEILHKNLINFALISTDENGGTAKTVVTLNMPNLKASFNEATYAGSISLDKKFTVDQITINDYIEGVTAEITESSKYFNLKQSGITVELTIVDPFPAEILTNKYVSLTIQLKEENKMVQTSTVTIDIEETSSGPKFTEVNYEATYNQEDKTIELKTDIKTKSVAKSVSVSGEYKDYFATKLVDDHWNIKITDKKLDDKILHKKFINFPLISTDEKGDTDTSSVTLNMPNLKASFNKATYAGSIGLDKKFIVDPITINNYIEGVTAEITETSKYFNLKQSGITVELTILDPFPAEILTNKYVSLTIQLKEENKIVQTSTVTIDIEETSSGPKFTQVNYEATYNQEYNTVELKSDIKTKSVAKSVSVGGEYKDYFATKLVDDHWNIKTTDKKLDNTILHKTFINFPLISTDENGDTETSSVTLNMPNLKASFNEATYAGSIGLDKIFTVDPITINDYIEGVTAEITENSKYFTLEQTGDTVKITINDLLPSDILNDKYFSLTIQLKEDNVIVQKSTLIVDLPSDNDNDDEEYYLRKELSEKDRKIKGFIAAVAVLSIMVVGSLSAFVYLKLRKPSLIKKSNFERKLSIEEKYRPDVEVDGNYKEPPTIRVEEIEEIENPKSVVFNEVVEELEVDSNHETDGDEDLNEIEGDPEEKKGEQIAKRRPTGFVFGKPDES